MKNLLKILSVFIILAFLVTIGCKVEKPDSQPAFNILKSHLINHGMDLPNLLTNWIVEATPLSEDGIVDTQNGYTIPAYHVFDIRSSAMYDDGHINGAINVPLASVVNVAAGYQDKPILVVCVTGQSAGHAVMALRLSGYADAQVLKWGMSGWNPDFSDPWATNTGDHGVGNANWVTTAAPAPGSFSDPAWTTSFIDGADILKERVDEMLNNGFKAVGPLDVLDTPGNYQIINFWSNEDYIEFGHYTGAFQIRPISLANNITKAFDPSASTAVYCFTGQTSSMATAWLNVLGYDAVSIKFGVNALNYTRLVNAEKPHWHGPMDYHYVKTP